MDNLKVSVGEDVVIEFRDGKVITVTPHMHDALTRMRAALIATAQAGAATTYGKLVIATGGPYLAQGLGPALDVLSVDCERRGEPSLAALVVRGDTGEVGDAFVGDADGERELCWTHWGGTDGLEVGK